MTAIYPWISRYFLNDAPRKLSGNLASTRLSILIDPIYCIISNSSYIVLIIYSTDSLSNQYTRCIRFRSAEAKKISQLLQLHEYICSNLSVSHSMYIGIELMKAEIAMILRQQFAQD
uniref:DUF4346 domain-containing protein n=1 Tax=Scinaia undulata TaxID=1884664 RepID=A0A1G4NXH9_9FLOR|nr:Hypothetical protein ORF_1 [Scinaia undulata]SCW23357.1 Hypothetical protein ORF_1 [Scinaia undulata]